MAFVPWLIGSPPLENGFGQFRPIGLILRLQECVTIRLYPTQEGKGKKNKDTKKGQEQVGGRGSGSVAYR